MTNNFNLQQLQKVKIPVNKPIKEVNGLYKESYNTIMKEIEAAVKNILINQENYNCLNGHTIQNNQQNQENLY